MWDERAVAIAFAVTTGGWLLALGLLAAYGVWGQGLVSLYASGFPGYEASLGGAITGGLYGLVTGTIFGYALAWVHNWARRRYGK